METNELIKIWNTLAENKLVGESIARESIQQIITKKGVGLLGKLTYNVRKEIITDIIASTLVALIIVGVFIFQDAQNINKRAHIILFIILAYFIYKLYNDVRKFKMLKVTALTGSIKNSVLHGYNRFKSQIRQDLIVSISFIVSVNIYAIFIYYKAFGNFSKIDFTHINGQTIGFILLIFLFLSVIITPLWIKYFFKKKYHEVINNFESTIKELN